MPPKSPVVPGFPIGVVSRLTNIHPETLRIWERRYGLVAPQRTGRGNRLYAQADIDRLLLVKALVDAGHPVGIVAPLGMDELRARLEAGQSRSVVARAPEPPESPARVVVVGSELALRMAHEPAALAGLRLAGAFRDIAEAETAAAALAPEVILLEFATLTPDTVAAARQLLERTGATGAVVVYRFGARQSAGELAGAGIASVRWPADLAEIGRLCAEARRAARVHVQPPAAEPAAPLRKFSPDQLARLAVMDTSVACECPRHLADLINSLAAFETYSGDCLVRNSQDAEVHAFLGAAAGRARALLETGLERVIALEKIDLG